MSADNGIVVAGAAVAVSAGEGGEVIMITEETKRLKLEAFTV